MSALNSASNVGSALAPICSNVNLVDAKAHLSKLVGRAAAGDRVRITRRGKPVAQITAVQIPRKRIDVLAVRVMTDRAPVQQETAREAGC
jgi:prevent-host-death family protein